MANLMCITTCKDYFKVKNPDEFEQTLRKHGLTQEKDQIATEGLWFHREKDKFLIYGYSELSIYDSDKEDYIQIEDIIQPQLQDGEICVFREVSYTKCRYDEGNGIVVIITPKQTKVIDLYHLTEQEIKNLQPIEETPTFYVVFKQGKEKVSTVKDTKDQLEAEKTARILNDGLQPKAKALGFHYVVEVEP